MSTKKDLSQAEIWDDSALINSWDEALEEYNHYHNIAARGEKVEELLRAADDEKNPEMSVKPMTKPSSCTELNTTSSNGNILPSEQGSAMIDSTKDVYVTGYCATQYEVPAETSAATPFQTPNASSPFPSLAPIPQALSGTVQDEGLKNLMMSWYYAGYYTGFHEGQRKAQQAGTA